ncbi:hypothetical protein Ae505Ps2_1413c [Pseudonocardia sp. Ae505_Ps2]|nr:hypothetical protein Ae505Ps2_1413c [Pseudonocardia sp. Ae505_Ps2]
MGRVVVVPWARDAAPGRSGGPPGPLRHGTDGTADRPVRLGARTGDGPALRAPHPGRSSIGSDGAARSPLCHSPSNYTRVVDTPRTGLGTTEW